MDYRHSEDFHISAGGGRNEIREFILASILLLLLFLTMI
jgi:hypothetical protein